jgi:hypothetical protein
LRIRSFAVALAVVTKAYVRAAVKNNRLTVGPATMTRPVPLVEPDVAVYEEA